MPTSFPMSIPHAPTGFVTQAALDTAFSTPINDLYALLLNSAQGLLGEASDTGSVTLATTGNTAGLAPVTFTLTSTRRVRIDVQARYQIVTASGRMILQAGYNTGATPVVGSAVKVGTGASIVPTVAGLPGTCSTWTAGTALLAAGQYTAYPVVTRFSGGSTTDIASAFETIVEDIGNV